MDSQDNDDLDTFDKDFHLPEITDREEKAKGRNQKEKASFFWTLLKSGLLKREVPGIVYARGLPNCPLGTLRTAGRGDCVPRKKQQFARGLPDCPLGTLRTAGRGDCVPRKKQDFARRLVMATGQLNMAVSLESSPPPGPIVPDREREVALAWSDFRR